MRPYAETRETEVGPRRLMHALIRSRAASRDVCLGPIRAQKLNEFVHSGRATGRVWSWQRPWQ